MPYATEADLASAFPNDNVLAELLLSDPNDSIPSALLQASERIDSVMLASGVAVPLAGTISGLLRSTLDIARWYLWQGYGFDVASDAGVTHHVRVRYLDAISWAESLAKSQAITATGEQNSNSAPRVRVSARAQVLTDCELSRLF